MNNIGLAILNIGMFAGWIFLAIHFDNFWIVFCVLLTMFSTKTEQRKED